MEHRRRESRTEDADEDENEADNDKVLLRRNS
jgi:hypothetical protein